MYHMRYSDVVEESGISARERESALFNRCIEKLIEVQVHNINSPIVIEAADFIEGFWIAIIEDLGREDNHLSNHLKASIISIGIYVMKEMNNLRNGVHVDIPTLIDISSSLRDGLAIN